MKTRFFLAAMAAIALVGCNKNELGNENQVNDGPASFLKVDLRAAGSITRAQAEDAFEYGLAEENAVNTVHFYFFDADGTAYPVQGVQNSMVLKGSGNNVLFALLSTQHGGRHDGLIVCLTAAGGEVDLSCLTA